MAQGEQWSVGGAQCEDGFLERRVAGSGAAGVCRRCGGGAGSQPGCQEEKGGLRVEVEGRV